MSYFFGMLWGEGIMDEASCWEQSLTIPYEKN